MYGKDWEAAYNAYFMEVILGTANVTTDWDAYIEKLNQLQYADYLDALNSAPTLVDLLEQYSK